MDVAFVVKIRIREDPILDLRDFRDQIEDELADLIHDELMDQSITFDQDPGESTECEIEDLTVTVQTDRR